MHPNRQETTSTEFLGITAKGEQYAVKWPKHLKRQLPCDVESQSLQEAFAWPTKVKENMKNLLAKIRDKSCPIISSGKCLQLTSHFSGICSQTRGAQILQNHDFGVSFEHISFTEMSKQCQKVLCKDFPDSCVHKNQLHCLDPKFREMVSRSASSTETQSYLDQASFASRSFCVAHQGMCRLQVGDIALFGAPCVDDSLAGKNEQMKVLLAKKLECN